MIDLCDGKASCALQKCLCKSSFQGDWQPAIAVSRSAINWEHSGRKRPSTLFAPMNDLHPWTVSGGGVFASIAT